MKKIHILLALTGFLFACNNTTTSDEQKATEEAIPTPAYASYGESIEADQAIQSTELLAMMSGKDSVATKVSGTILSSCKVKGCWMIMDMGNGEEMRISFKDYGFFVPTDLQGETAIIEGYAKMDTTSVDDLRHFAVDGGMSEEEAAAKYTEAEVSLNFVATGVLIEEKEEATEVETQKI